MKISTKISFFVMGAGMVTLLGVGYFGFTLTRLLLERTISENQVQLARQALDQLDRYIYYRWHSILTLSEDPTLKTFMSESRQPPDVIALEYTQLKNIPGPWEQLMVVDADDRILVNVRAEGQAILENISQSPELLHAKESAMKGVHYYSDVELSSHAQEHVLTFSSPIYSTLPGKEIQGAIVGQITWNTVLAELQTAPGSIHIFNNRGEILGGNREKYPNPPLLDSLPHKKELSIVTENTEEHTQTLLSSVTERGFLDYRGNGWILTFETPTQVAFAPATKNILILLFIIIPLILLVGIFLFFVLRIFIVSPIKRFQEGLDIISSGNLDYSLDIRTNDEIGRLAHAFNHMTMRLKEALGNLEQQVKSRTKELNQKIEILQHTERAVLNIMDDLEMEKSAIIQERAKYKTLLESIDDGVIALDMSGHIIYANHSAASLLGWNIEEMIHVHFSDLWSVEDEQGKKFTAENRPLSRVIKTNSKLTTALTPTYYYTRKNGTRFPVAITITPIIANDTTIGILDVFRDISHLKDIDKAKSEFVSLASHQLRTPTATINWYVELLLAGNAGAVTPEQKDFLNEIYGAAQRMVKLIDALLNTSRLELGTLPIKKIPTDISLMADEILNELATKITNKKISVKKTYLSRSLPLSIDPDLIRVIFENLISNAIDYNHEKGSLTISISKRASDLLISVADTGYGIPKHQQSQIFTKMFRADNIRTIDPNGNGLGLYMTKSIIEKLGGKIWFESEEDKGTTFFFTLPLQ